MSQAIEREERRELVNQLNQALLMLEKAGCAHLREAQRLMEKQDWSPRKIAGLYITRQEINKIIAKLRKGYLTPAADMVGGTAVLREATIIPVGSPQHASLCKRALAMWEQGQGAPQDIGTPWSVQKAIWQEIIVSTLTPTHELTLCLRPAKSEAMALYGDSPLLRPAKPAEFLPERLISAPIAKRLYTFASLTLTRREGGVA